MKRLRRIVHRAVVMGLLGCASGSRPALAAGTQTVTVESRTITVRIDRPFDKVYEFSSIPPTGTSGPSVWAGTSGAHRTAVLAKNRNGLATGRRRSKLWPNLLEPQSSPKVPVSRVVSMGRRNT